MRIEMQTDRGRQCDSAAVSNDICKRLVKAEIKPSDMLCRYAMLEANGFKPNRNTPNFVRIGANRQLFNCMGWSR